MSVPNPEAASRIRVLVIDDDRAVCDVVLHILRRAGFEAAGAYDGATGFKEALATAPNLIVLDVKMPELDGLETLTRLRENPATRDIVIVAFTGLVIDDESLRFRGFDDVILKPILACHLVERLGRVLREKGQKLQADQLSAMWRRVSIA
jgi:two-component system OmpR family response regulator